MQKLILFSLIFATHLSFAAYTDDIGGPQGENEKEIKAVVRNKRYYKADQLELSLGGGGMPYDSTVRHYQLGGRLAWHLSDHYGWEVIDAQYILPSVTSFTTDLTVAKRLNKIEVLKVKTVIGTNFLLSPIYGKVRFFGSQVLYFDLYGVVGGGAANTEGLRYKYVSSGGVESAQETSLGSTWNPMFDVGVGFKVFLGKNLGLSLDLRDYVILAELYGEKSPRSYFTVTGNFSFFFPGF